MRAMAGDEEDPTESTSSERLRSAVRRKRRRHEKNEREADESFWSTAGMMGTIGWSVALPTAAGVLFGRWLDGVLGAGQVFMVFFMLVGLALGCILAWRQVAEKM